MTNETSGPPTDFNQTAFKYIDEFAGRAKAIVELSSPFVDEIAVAVRSFRNASGAPPRDGRETQSEGQELGAMAFGVIKRQPLASLAVAGALAAAGYYIVRAQKAG